MVATLGAPLIAGTEGWYVRPGHFAERHGLIIIIALGESVVALGVSAAEEPQTFTVITASLMGLALVACLWWIYFDVVAHAAELALVRYTKELSELRVVQAAHERRAYTQIGRLAVCAFVAGVFGFVFAVAGEWPAGLVFLLVAAFCARSTWNMGYQSSNSAIDAIIFELKQHINKKERIAND